jgi:hypothetical protein
MAINLKTEENPFFPLKEIEDSGVGGEVTIPSSKPSFLIDKYNLILAKLQTADSLQGRIKKIDEEIKNISSAIDVLRSKELYYLNDIEVLKNDLDNIKVKVFDEGAAFGFAEPVLREFK